MTEIYYYVLDGPGEGAAMLHVNANWLLGADDTALPDEIVQKYIDGYISAYADNSSFKREAATVAGLEGIRVFCIMEDDYAHDMFIFSDGMVVYTFSFMAYQEEYYLYEGIFNEILNSIQIGDGEEMCIRDRRSSEGSGRGRLGTNGCDRQSVRRSISVRDGGL